MSAYRYLDNRLVACDWTDDAVRELQPGPLPVDLSLLWYTRRERRKLARAKGRRRAVRVPKMKPVRFDACGEIIAYQAHHYRFPSGGEVVLYLPAGERPTVAHSKDAWFARRGAALPTCRYSATIQRTPEALEWRCLCGADVELVVDHHERAWRVPVHAIASYATLEGSPL